MIDGLLGYFVFGNIAFRLQTNRGFLFRYHPQAIATPSQSIKCPQKSPVGTTKAHRC